MVVRKKLLQGSAAGAARMILRALLDDWVRTRRGVMQPGNADSVHDFRVALRRLRSILRAFRPVLPLPKGLRRRLRRLARATDESRNLEIWQAWIGEHANQLTARQRAGVSWLQAGLRNRRQRADARMRSRITRWFSCAGEELRQVGAGRGPKARPQDAAAVVQRSLRTGAAVLARQLGQIASMRDREAIHNARIAAKRLRYLLEELEDELPETGGILVKLEKLQGILGEVHDAHVFADLLRAALAETGEQRVRMVNEKLLPWPVAGGPNEPAAPPGVRRGLLALARRLRGHGEARFEQLKTEWLEGQSAELVVRLGQLSIQSSAKSGRPDLNRRLPAPKAGALPD
jgi:CHAD domain-containing protein